MSLHTHNIAFDHSPAMGYQYYDGDQYYDALSVSASHPGDGSLYQSYSFYAPDNLMLAAPLDPQGEQQWIQTPIQEYPQGEAFASAPIHTASQGSSCIVSPAKLSFKYLSHAKCGV